MTSFRVWDSEVCSHERAAIQVRSREPIPDTGVTTSLLTVSGLPLTHPSPLVAPLTEPRPTDQG